MTTHEENMLHLNQESNQRLNTLTTEFLHELLALENSSGNIALISLISQFLQNQVAVDRNNCIGIISVCLKTSTRCYEAVRSLQGKWLQSVELSDLVDNLKI